MSAVATEPQPRFRIMGWGELQALPPPEWLIEGILPKNSFAVLYGDPGCKKTFIALSMALSAAAGHDWCGKKTAPCSVLYVAAEGLTGLKVRVAAYGKKHGLDLTTARIAFLGDGLNLMDSANVEQLCAALRENLSEPDLIVLDTLARVAPGADENSAKEMGLAVAAIDRLRRETSASVIVIHHKGKAGSHERGSSALRGAADVMIDCSSKDNKTELNCTKMKDAREFDRLHVAMEEVKVGEAIFSLAVATEANADDESTSAELALCVLEQIRGRCARNSTWLNIYKAVTGKSKSTFDRSLKELKKAGLVRQEKGLYYPNRSGVSVTAVSDGCHDTT